MPRPAGPGSKSPIGGYNPDALPFWPIPLAVLIVVMSVIWFVN